MPGSPGAAIHHSMQLAVLHRRTSPGEKYTRPSASTSTSKKVLLSSTGWTGGALIRPVKRIAIWRTLGSNGPRAGNCASLWEGFARSGSRGGAEHGPWYSQSMDVERTMEFILVTQAKTEVRMERLTTRMDGITKIVRTGMKMLVRLGEDQRKMREDMRTLAASHRELAAAQERTEHMLQAFIQSLQKGGTAGGPSAPDLPESIPDWPLARMRRLACPPCFRPPSSPCRGLNWQAAEKGPGRLKACPTMVPK